MTVLLIALLAVAAGLLLFIATRDDVSPAFAVAFGLTFLFWYAVPIVTTLMFPNAIGWRTVVPLDAFIRVGVLEVASYIVVLLLCALPWRTFRVITRGSLARRTIPPALLSPLLVVFVVLDFVLRRVIWWIVGGSYYSGNAFAVQAEGSAIVGVLGIIFTAEWVLRAFLYAAAVLPGPRRSRAVSVILWGGITAMALVDVMDGVRIQLLTPCVLALMYVHGRRLSRTVLLVVYAGIAGFLATVGVLATIVIVSLRGGSELTMQETVATSREVQEQSVSERAWRVLDEVNLKFDGISPGARLLSSYGVGQAGFRPYEGALLALVPRLLVPSKPVPSSADGTNRGVPQRLVATDIGLNADIGNVPVSPAAIGMWQMGWFGLLLFVLINAFQFRLINSLMMSGSLALQTLAFLLIGVPALVLIAPGDFVIMTMQRALGFFFVATATILLYRTLFGALPRRRSAAARPHRGLTA